MQVMVDRGIDPFAHPVFTEAFRIQFPAKVTVNIIKDHEQEKEGEMDKMNRDQENKYNEYSCFNNGFKGGEKHKLQKDLG